MLAPWRHYVELQLKALVGDLERFLDEPMRRRGGHDIQQLWSELRPLLVRAYPAEERKDRSIVGRVLRQLAELDPDNQAFRYDERRDGTPTLDGVKYLDIELFHEAMLGVANYLEAIETAVDHDQDLKNAALQMAWEVQQEFEQDMRRSTSSTCGTSTATTSSASASRRRRARKRHSGVRDSGAARPRKPREQGELLPAIGAVVASLAVTRP